MNFPKRLTPVLKALTKIKAEPTRDDIDSIGKKLAKERNIVGQMFLLETDQWKPKEYRVVYSWYYRVTEARWVRETRKALIDNNIKINAEHTSKRNRYRSYRSYWFELEDCAFEITSLRRGGKGIISVALSEMHEILEDNKVRLAEAKANAKLVESAKTKLTDAEKRALEIYK